MRGITIESMLSGITSWKESWKGFQERCSEILPMNARNLEIIFKDNPRRLHPMVNDKVVAKGILEAGGVDVPRTIAVIESFFQMKTMDEVIDLHSEFVIKPANGSGGEGIFLAAESVDGGVRTPTGRFVSRDHVRRHVAEILYGSYSGNVSDKALIEERLHPHPLFQAIWPVGLPDIRLIVHHGRPIASMVRLPTKASKGTANLHQGGVGVGLDLGTGEPIRAVCRGMEIREHPDSHFPLHQTRIPDWAKVVATGVQAASLFPLGYVGVDLILDRDAAVKVLELNARPGLQIQIATGMGLRRSLTCRK